MDKSVGLTYATANGRVVFSTNVFFQKNSVRFLNELFYSADQMHMSGIEPAVSVTK